MVEKKAALVEIVAHNGNVAFWRIDKHLEGKDRRL